MSVSSGASVSTYMYDLARTGANQSETILNQTNVTAHFHRRWSLAVTGLPFAQPLVVENVAVSGIKRTLLIVATNSNYLYAFDATTGATVWTLNNAKFGAPFDPTTVPGNGPSATYLINGLDGILGTPVVDPATNIIYLTSTNNVGLRKLYALNLADGSDAVAPVTMDGSAAGITFVSHYHMQRPAILLLSGVLYIGLGTYGDSGFGYGWMFSYRASDLTHLATYMTNPADGSVGASIWSAPTSDGTNIFATSGSVASCAAGDFSEAVLEWSGSSLVLSDFMQPSNCGAMNTGDQDLGSSRPLVVGNYILAIGKDGRFWSLNKGALGSVQGSGPPINQVFRITPSNTTDAMYNGYVYANGFLYVSGGADVLFENTSSFAFNTSTGILATSSTTDSAVNYAWTALSYSSNGVVSGTPVLWVSETVGNPAGTYATGVLRAYNPTTMAQLWSSATVAGDAVGSIAKFVPPVVTNGNVYMASFGSGDGNGSVLMFGVVPSVSVTGQVSISGNVSMK